MGGQGTLETETWQADERWNRNCATVQTHTDKLGYTHHFTVPLEAN